MLLLRVKHTDKRPLLEHQYVDAAEALRAGGVTHNVDQSIDCVQAPEQIVVLAIAAREERGEVRESNALEAVDPLEAFERARILRADAVDQNFIQLTDLARACHREGQHVPERETKIVDQHLAPRVGMPLRRVE